MMNENLRAIIWTAVSSKRQAEDDKESLKHQEAAARAICEREGWQVVDVLVVPGHTRSYIDFYEMADAAAQADIDAFHRLRQHWIAQDFDVLIVRDGDRFAREQAPVAFVIGMVIQSGARIYSLQDGWVDKQNHRFAAAMIGYRASAEVDQLKIKQKAAKDGRVLQGVFMGSRIPYAFRAVRNEFGKIQSIEIDESKRRLFDDVATLVLESVGWRHLEQVLFERFGHVDHRTGKPFKRFFFYHLLYNPWIWGHGARRYKVADSPNGQSVGSWAFDESEAVPEGILLERNTHEPLYTGAIAIKLKAELHRRQLLRGGARAGNSHKFTGLILCGYCGYYMVFDGKRSPSGKEKASYRCHSRYVARNRDGCDKYRHISERKIQTWLTTELEAAIIEGLPDWLGRDSQIEPAINRVDAIRGEIDALNKQIDALIDKQSVAPAAIQDRYTVKLAEFADHLLILKHNLKVAEQAVPKIDIENMQRAFQEIKAFDNLDSFWNSGDTNVNATLHRLFGNRRMVVMDSKVTDTADAPPHPRQSHGLRKKRKPS